MIRSLLILLLLLPGALWGQTSSNDDGFGKDLGTFKVTYYWIAFEKHFKGAATVPLLDPKGRTLAMVSDSFARSVTVEGTGVLLDGRVVNLHSECPSAPTGWCFFEVNRKKAPFGYGTKTPLKPFRTIAVNKGIEPGTVVYLPDFIGISLPSDEGEIDYHDGCFVAEDIGWGLEDHHIDIFVLAENYYQILHRSIGNKYRVRIYTDSPLCPDSARLLYEPSAWMDELEREDKKRR